MWAQGVGSRGLLAAAVLVAVLGGGAATGHVRADRAFASHSSPCGRPGPNLRIEHVVVIAFENHSYKQILGPSAPSSYFKTLAAQCGVASNFQAAWFPRSLPNYLAVTSGRVPITEDCTPGLGCSTPDRNLFTELGRNQWRAWAESMPAPCYKKNTAEFVPRHVPPVYYTRILHKTCLMDVRALPPQLPPVKRAFVWVTPNLQHDMHNGTPAQASAWLQGFLDGSGGLLRSRAYTSGHTALFIWFDSASGTGKVTTPIPLIVVSPHTPHHVFDRVLNDYDVLHAWQAIFRIGCLAQSCRFGGLGRLYHLVG
jgi:phosphatidylinositol-3-phosphatase